jgi:hypothetical protein
MNAAAGATWVETEAHGWSRGYEGIVYIPRAGALEAYSNALPATQVSACSAGRCVVCVRERERERG